MMKRADAHDGVMSGIETKITVATATGRDTAKRHLVITPGPVIRAITDDREPVFRWDDRPVCGAVSTAGWIKTERSDPRLPCQTCSARWRQLVDRYLGYADREVGRRW